ncbi:MAG: amidohydrolase family protein [Spirochaetales bacterium]|nr:amidohydrolase family protein [Leptospiraceae bacterium]MCP5483759.1 amidohydrolase family protein [Spirochaetales bacterium]
MIDIHVHFFPPAIFRAIWRYFEQGSHGLWPILYRVHTKKHVEMLRSFGVERFTSLLYAHKAGLADSLNAFVREWSAKEAALLPFGTIYCGDGNVAGKARTLFEDWNFYGIKLHPFVSHENLDDERMFDAYEVMEALDRVVVCHPGSAPVYDQTDGPRRLRRILERFPRLKVVVAHCGAFEYGDYTALAHEYEGVYFDTAMNCVHTHVFRDNCPGPSFFLQFQDRILFGTDFPNLPYDYMNQVDALKALELGEEIERKIFSENARRLLGLEPAGGGGQ